MENYNSNGKDFYGIERYPNDFMNGLEIDDKIESIPGLMDQMLEGFDKSEKPVKNVEVRQDGLSKFFTYIKNFFNDLYIEYNYYYIDFFLLQYIYSNYLRFFLIYFSLNNLDIL